jgi:hypothetical protein
MQASEKHVLDLIGDEHRFPAFAKPASEQEARLDKIMRKDAGGQT